MFPQLGFIFSRSFSRLSALASSSILSIPRSLSARCEFHVSLYFPSTYGRLEKGEEGEERKKGEEGERLVLGKMERKVGREAR